MIKCSSEVLIKQLSTISSKFEAMIDIHFSIMEHAMRIGAVPEDARQQCIELIKEYDCISSSMRDLDRTSTVSMNIFCTIDVPVVYRID